MAPTAVTATTVIDPADEAVSSEVIVDEVASDADLVVDELLVEEISIDGMCGVY